MKNYTLNNYDAEIFITNYEETDGKIIVNYADGSNKIVENNKDYKRVINNIMQEQVLGNNTKKFKNKKSKSFFRHSIFLSICIIMTLISIFLMFITETYILSSIVLLIESIITSIVAYETIELNGIIKDIDKHIFFVENKEQINNAILSNKNALDNVKKETKIIATQSKKEPLNINKIHKIKYMELKKILESIKEQQEENFVKVKIKES